MGPLKRAEARCTNFDGASQETVLGTRISTRSELETNTMPKMKDNKYKLVKTTNYT